jgi:vacuolar-type H+-ATPase subunit E/Vma4
MTERPGAAPEAAIIERILEDARAEAARLLENAGRGATAEKNKTEREIAKIEKEARAGWDDKVEKVRMREISTARVEARRVLLNAREKAIDKMFGEVEMGLGRLREDPGRYREALRNLAAEALTAVAGGGAVLRISESDRGYADDDFLRQVESRMGDAAAGTHFHVEFDREDYGGGCIATSADGRIVFDNTFGRRMERLRPEIRAMMVKELEKSHG